MTDALSEASNDKHTVTPWGPFSQSRGRTKRPPMALMEKERGCFGSWSDMCYQTCPVLCNSLWEGYRLLWEFLQEKQQVGQGQVHAFRNKDLSLLQLVVQEESSAGSEFF